MTWHKNAGRAEKEGGYIPQKKRKPLSFALFLTLLLHQCVCVRARCVSEAAWLDWMGGLVSRSLSAITHVHLHTVWASVGMKRGLWLWLILEGHTLNTTVNNRAIWVVHTKLKFRGESWATQPDCISKPTVVFRFLMETRRGSVEGQSILIGWQLTATFLILY